jgi:PPOX class probable F420-dependent enzyme
LIMKEKRTKRAASNLRVNDLRVLKGDNMPPRMSRSAREEFLAGLHVGVLSVASGDGSGPLAVPVWYTYQLGGTVNVSTGRATRKAQAIVAAGRFSLCAQDERPPYKYVTVEGPVAVEDATDAERREIARRYLGAEGGDAFLAAAPTEGQVMLRMTPERWSGVDYGQG